VAATHATQGSKFNSVSGTWVVPTATCTPGQEGYSAVWVGLGGYRENAKGLEQLGTEQDCARNGAASYSAWLEILPAGAVSIHMTVHPGDTMTASSTVAGKAVTFRIRDLTTGAHYASTRHASATDVSTADWIVESPSACSASGSCQTLPLASISTVQFAGATAISGAQTRAAGYAAWSNTALELEQALFSFPSDAGTQAQARPVRTVVTAAPSPTTSPYGAFSVSVTEQASQLALPPRPELPGLGRR
jgi:hypothetical protein